MKSRLVRQILIGSVILLCLVFLLTQCRKPEIIAEFDLYSIGVLDGQYYLILDESRIYESQNEFVEGNMISEPAVEFDSMYDFLDAVLNGKLQRTQLKEVMRFRSWDEHGIKICDFSDLCHPVFPEDLYPSHITWRGENYQFVFSNYESVHGVIYIKSKEQYDYDFKKSYINFSDTEAINVIQKETIADRNAEVTYYTNANATSQYKRVQYSFQQGGTQYFVDERYRLSSSYKDAFVSDTVPYSITMDMENGRYFCNASLNGFSERPSEEWLREFNLEKYEHPSS